jgi:hypothetical protein
MRTLEAIGACVAAALLGGCGLNVTSPDLFQLTRTGQRSRLVVLVNDSGTIRCNNGKTQAIPDPLLLQARGLVTSLDKDAKAHLSLPPTTASAFSYSIRFQTGTVSFPDTAAGQHHELAAVEQFALAAARGPCGLGG